METKTVNSAAGTVISGHDRVIPPRKLARYRMSLAVLNTMLREGALSEADYAAAKSVLACHYGLSKDSIFC